MYVENSLVKKHFQETESLVRRLDKNDVSNWLLGEGYFPESHILPPSFRAKGCVLKKEPFNKDVNNLTRRKLTQITYPKTLLTSRTFSIQHPWNYHDIVYYLNKIWERVLDIIFFKGLSIFSYSFPIPISKTNKGKLGGLREGRLIYEWVRMAENDLVADASYYRFIAKTDISNFYSSIYTHSIAWALEGREVAFQDKSFSLVGNKIDRLTQYSNDGRTNGISVGSALSDIIAEIILSDIDAQVSKELKDVNFVGVRFKDDYRILCESEGEAKTILKVLSNKFSEINLSLNESKTFVHALPDGLYRSHDREYFPHSLKNVGSITFRQFEHTLLIALDIHRKWPGTGILEKFISELFDMNHNLKVCFSKHKDQKIGQIKKMISILFLVKRESEKLVGHVLSVVQAVYVSNLCFKYTLKSYLSTIIENELKKSAERGSVFEIVWYVFFSRYMGLGITNFESLIGHETFSNNEFIETMIASRNHLYKDTGVDLFLKPSFCKSKKLAWYLDVFSKSG